MVRNLHSARHVSSRLVGVARALKGPMKLIALSPRKEYLCGAGPSFEGSVPKAAPLVLCKHMNGVLNARQP